MKTITLILCLLCSVPGYSQVTWKQYENRLQVSLGSLNAGMLVYMNQKQNFAPVKTQKWLNPLVCVPVISFTICKAIQWDKRSKARIYGVRIIEKKR
jgi:hypothetical protein